MTCASPAPGLAIAFVPTRMMMNVAVWVLAATAALSDGELGREAARITAERTKSGAFSGAVIVAKNGRAVFDNGNRKRFDIASLGKMFTSVAMAQLEERGLVSFDAPVGTYLRDLPNQEIADKVTLAQLLTHTSGVPDLPEDIFRTPPKTLSGYLHFLQNAKLDFAPGEKRSYSNAGFVLLGMVIERVSGETYERYLERHVFKRARMSHSIARQPHGGSLSTAADLVRFFEALRNGRLVKRETAVKITTSMYGFGTIEFDTDRLAGHSGGSYGISADAYLYWNSGYAIVVLSDLEPPASHEVAGALRKLIEPRFASR